MPTCPPARPPARFIIPHAELEASLEEWGKKEAARCDSGDPDIELCELPGIINTPPAERSAVDEAWSRGRRATGPPARPHVTCRCEGRLLCRAACSPARHMPLCRQIVV